MPTITVLPEGKTIQATEGTKLLQALLAAGANLSHRCNGNLSCGTCHIFIHDGRKTVSRIAPGENAMLDSIPGVGSKSRLACQVTIGADDLSVELLGFASGG
jgi:ferredoxin, 2Fe-2S